jgi:hypothetical protein
VTSSLFFNNYHQAFDVSNNPHPQIEMSFSEVYGSVLEPFIQKFKDGENEKGRRAVVRDAAEAVKNYREMQEDEGAALPKDLQTVRLVIFLFLHSFSPMFVTSGYHPIYQRGDEEGGYSGRRRQI